MNDNFNEQKDVLLSIKREISLLHQQVDYLIRNGKPLGLLDLDVMMNRTHTIYDLMCSVNVGSEALEGGSDEEELPVGLDEIRSMFGIEEENEETHEEEEFDEVTEELLDKEEEELIEETEKPNEEPEGLHEETEALEQETEALVEEAEELLEKEESEEEKEKEEEKILEEETPEEDEDAYFIDEVDDVPDEEPAPNEVPTEEPQNNGTDDLGFILNFEPVTEESEETAAEEPKEEQLVFTTGDEIEMTIPHEENTNAGETEPAPINEEEEIVYEPVVIGDMEDHDDGGFELEQPETLGERYQQNQEETVGEKLQHSTVTDLQRAIGINDKFLFVNELFGGSMEKYNRSIGNLNDLKTLNGALIYLNELRIELQWNSSNEAYKRLLELVHRKFES